MKLGILYLGLLLALFTINGFSQSSSCELDSRVEYRLLHSVKPKFGDGSMYLYVYVPAKRFTTAHMLCVVEGLKRENANETSLWVVFYDNRRPSVPFAVGEIGSEDFESGPVRGTYQLDSSAEELSFRNANGRDVRIEITADGYCVY